MTSVYDVLTTESTGAIGDSPPTITDTIAQSNLPGIDYQIQGIMYLVHTLFTTLDTIGLNPQVPLFYAAKAVNHPSVEYCGSTIATCGPFQLLWDNFVIVYNDPTQPYQIYYPIIRAVIVFLDFNIMFWPWFLIMMIRAAIWIVKFIGILDLQKKEYSKQQTF